MAMVAQLGQFLFQLTAARRRLGDNDIKDFVSTKVSTHSRPKAAGKYTNHHMMPDGVSTHSRPKAAGSSLKASKLKPHSFNSQPPEGGWHAFA